MRHSLAEDRSQTSQRPTTAVRPCGRSRRRSSLWEQADTPPYRRSVSRYLSACHSWLRLAVAAAVAARARGAAVPALAAARGCGSGRGCIAPRHCKPLLAPSASAPSALSPCHPVPFLRTMLSARGACMADAFPPVPTIRVEGTPRTPRVEHAIHRESMTGVRARTHDRGGV